MIRSNTHSCFSAAIVNAVHAERSIRAATVVLGMGNKREEDRLSAFRALAEKKSGVYIVRLRDDVKVDYEVGVDAKRSIIVDSEETCALELTASVLERCGGEYAKNIRVQEVRKIQST
eukprot:IDg1494t1